MSQCKCFSTLHKLLSGPGPISRLLGLPLHYVAEQKLSTDTRYKYNYSYRYRCIYRYTYIDICRCIPPIQMWIQIQRQKQIQLQVHIYQTLFEPQGISTKYNCVHTYTYMHSDSSIPRILLENLIRFTRIRTRSLQSISQNLGS